MNINVNLALAELKVKFYADESHRLMKDHYDAMSCLDCEGFLQSGINAFEWLKRTEEMLREADYEGIFDFTQEIHCAFDVLYVAWLKPCDVAEQWIAKVSDDGFEIKNLSEFRDTCDQAHDEIQLRESRRIAMDSRVLLESQREE